MPAANRPVQFILCHLLPLIPTCSWAADAVELQKKLDELRAEHELLAEQVANLSLEAGDLPAAWRLPIDIAVSTTAIGGSSTANDDELSELQAGGHDPNRRGFIVPSTELILAGTLNPWMSGEVRVVTFIDREGESGVELEEAYLRSLSLPAGLELMAGQYFTPIGRINRSHPHAWDWLDQPVIMSRIFGPEGMRSQGATLCSQLGLLFLDKLQLTVQNANGETMSSFVGEDGIGGRPVQENEVHSLSDLVTTIGWRAAWEYTNFGALRIGADYSLGPNNLGIDTRSSIIAGHIALRISDDDHGLLQPGDMQFVAEGLRRAAEVDVYLDDPDQIPANGDEVEYPADKLVDWGFVGQFEIGVVPQWSAGLRYEWATGKGESVDGRNQDPLRADRWRVSPLIKWQPHEMFRVRLQYNLDRSDHLADAYAHTVWLGLDVVLGSHQHVSF